MKYLNRDLAWVAAVVVFSALAADHLVKGIQQDKRATADLNASTRELERLARRDPYPNSANLSAARQEIQRFRGFLADLQKHFAASAEAKSMDSASFRARLESGRAALLVDAARHAVELPADYWFTFAAEKRATTFSPAVLEPLSGQLADIGLLCGVVFDANVNALAWLKRVAVDPRDTLGGQDYLAAKPVTNTWTVAWPYEVSFHGFSSDLAAVLDALNGLPQCFVVRNLAVEPLPQSNAPTEPPSVLAAGGEAERLRDRYHRTLPPQTAPPHRRGSPDFLGLKPLRFTLSIEAVTLRAHL